MPVNTFVCRECDHAHDRYGIYPADYVRCPECEVGTWHHRER